MLSDNDDKTQSHIILSTGTMVLHYRIVEKIGAGGMGEVYLAEDTKLNRRVALKFLPPHLRKDEDCRLRFTREAQATAKLNHPNIVTIHEVSEYKNCPFFAMEHVEGLLLKDIISKKELSIDKTIDLSIQICKGLDKAHQAGIIHRDIKPSNIVIDNNNLLKLLDFGLAALEAGEKITKSGSTIGTIGYMAPEQIQTDEADHRSDLFSFGVVLYEMVSGRKPFIGDTEASAMNSILNDTPEPLKRYKSGISGDMEKIVSKLLEKNRELRYQSAADVISDLKKLTVQKTAKEVAPTDWWNRYIVVGAAIVLAIMAGIWMFGDPGIVPYKAKHPDRKMLAVLPFENLGAAEDDYFADGITEEIISRLTVVKGLGVISSTSANAYKNTSKTLPQIANELDVDYILEGSIRWEKANETDRVRITPKLIRVSDDMHLWAENYDRPLIQIFALQSEIAERIVNRLGITLGTIEDTQLRTAPTDNIEAYNLYLKGAYHLSKQTVEGFRQGKMYLDQALEVDSNFALAWAGQAAYYTFSVTTGAIPASVVRPLAQRAAEKSLSLDSMLAEAHLTYGWINSHMNWDWTAADREFKRALELAPGNSTAHLAYASYLAPMNRLDEAVTEMETAITLDPLSPLVNQVLGWVYYMSGDLDKAVAQYKKTIELDRLNVWAHAQLAWSYAYNNMFDEAVAECDLTLNELKPEFDPWLYSSLASVYAMAGREDDARGLAMALQDLPDTVYVDPFCYAVIYANLNQTNKALDMLEQAYQIHSPQTLFLQLPSSRNFFLKSISGDKRYQDLIDQMDFPAGGRK